VIDDHFRRERVEVRVEDICEFGVAEVAVLGIDPGTEGFGRWINFLICAKKGVATSAMYKSSAFSATSLPPLAQGRSRLALSGVMGIGSPSASMNVHDPISPK
jgi:hypothetical protein